MTYRATEEKVLKYINNLKVHTAWKISHLWGPSKAIDLCKVIEEREATCLEGITELMEYAGMGQLAQEMAIQLQEHACDVLGAHANRRVRRKMQRYSQKTANRAKYLPEAELTRYVTGTGLTRWTADGTISTGSNLRSLGLLPCAVEHLWGTQEVPVCVSIQNGLPPDPDNERQKQKIGHEQWHNLAMNGIAVSGERLGWTMNGPWWSWLNKMFPRVIDLAAYNHSLNSPVLPSGFFTDIPVVLTTIRSISGQKSNCDGSGRYHPQTPELKEFVERYGAVTFQFRFINQRGTFAKGILVPDERCITDSKPSIWLDWAQVKGVKKPVAAKFAAEGKSFQTSGFMGIIKCWNKPGRISICFEAFENIQNTEENQKLVEKLVDEQMESLRQDGPEGMVARVARDDDRINTILKLTTAMRSLGSDISPMHIKLIKQAVATKLAKRKYEIANGTGHKSPLYCFVIDDDVPTGKCVVAKKKVGSKLALFRFPIVLAQGLVTLEVTEPLDNHLVDGEIVPWTVFMNSNDLVTKMQGDDDGDDGGVDDDPRILKLWDSLIDDGIYHIEPEGVKFDTKSNTPEGLEYLRYDQRGDVGRVTVYRARLLAVGDEDGARAMSLMIQESIDCAKRRINWSDWRKASRMSNWVADNHGEYHYDIKLPTSAYGPDGTMPMDDIKSWVNHRLQQAGVTKPFHATLWRHEGKRIGEAWPSCRTDAVQGNLVHHIHEYARERWQHIADEFQMNTEELNLSNLLPKLLATIGMDVQPKKLKWEEYEQGLRRHSGIIKFGADFSSIMKRSLEEDARHRELDNVIAQLEQTLKMANLSLEELCTIWYMETTPRWTWYEKDGDRKVQRECFTKSEAPRWAKKANNPNHAFRAIAWDGSPIMFAMGIEQEGSCSFLTPGRRSASLNIAMGLKPLWREEGETDEEFQRRNSIVAPAERLAEMVRTAVRHGEEVLDEDGYPIEGHQCPYCTKELQNMVVQRMRSDRKREERRWMAELISSLNHG